MGAHVQEHRDGLTIRRSRLHGTVLDSKADHRIVMTLATAALGATGETVIRDIACIRKTFPHFVSEMENVGAVMISDQ